MDTTNFVSYESTADQLVSRILALIPVHQEILTMASGWDLLKVQGFKCDDLSPSLFQVHWALATAKQKYYKSL
jgi:hypothetical protein